MPASPAEADSLPPVPGFGAYQADVAIASASSDGDIVTLAWSDGRVSRFHAIFLRDHAMEPGTYNSETREHVREVDTYPAELGVVDVAVAPAGALIVTFVPETLTVGYHPGWLRAHDYSGVPAADPADMAPQLWRGAELATPPTFDGPAALADGAVLADWLAAVARLGIARLADVPTEAGMVRRIAERIGPIRVSNFGDVFDVRTKIDPDSNAYTGLALFPHTDLSTREYEPGLQFLHCLENTTRGGEAVYVDGYRVAEDLRGEEPETFAALTTIPWSFTNRARDTDYRFRTPIVVLDASGAVREVRLTGFLRAPLQVPFHDVPRAYAALRRLSERLRRPDYAMRFVYRPGDLMLFDNRRILHGRDSFDAAGGRRWLQGCYSEREELLSRLRVLHRNGHLRS